VGRKALQEIASVAKPATINLDFWGCDRPSQVPDSRTDSGSATNTIAGSPQYLMASDGKRLGARR